MPSTVAEIFAAACAEPAGVVAWGDPPGPPGPDVDATGMYVVAVTDEVEQLIGTLDAAPLSAAGIDELLAACPELTLDKSRPTRDELAARLAAFWFPDEVVLYIGLAGPRSDRPRAGELAKRVCDYYTTPLGARSPHAGGWPLKTLARLDQLHVHYAYCGRVDDAEKAAIGRFAAQVSDATRDRLHDAERIMPFANLEFPPGTRKRRGIRGARCADGPSLGNRPPAQPAVTQRERDAPGAPPQAGGVSVHRTQGLTAHDIAVGQVRVPAGPTKTALPPERGAVRVVLRGRELACSWDPRYGDRERSGVIRIGRAAAADLLTVGDVLIVEIEATTIRLT